MSIDKLLSKIRKDKAELAKAYNTDESKIIYTGDNKYIVTLQDGREVRI